MRTDMMPRKLTEEHKRKIAEAHKGYKFSEETKQKIREAHLGRKHTEETKRKISEVRKGKGLGNKNHKGKSCTWTEEQKRKHSERITLWHKQNKKTDQFIYIDENGEESTVYQGDTII